MRILSRRQKIIKFADRSETGWAVVGRVRGRYLGIKLGRRETNGEGGERFDLSQDITMLMWPSIIVSTWGLNGEKLLHICSVSILAVIRTICFH